MTAGLPRDGTLAMRVLTLLRLHPGLTDRELTEALGGSTNRAAVNERARRMQARGIIDRRTVDGHIRNYLSDESVAVAIPPRETSATLPFESPPTAANSSRADTDWFDLSQDPERPWFWEGNVQATIIAHLRQMGWTIRRAANTSTREAGKDIEAGRIGEKLWVTVKGYPDNPNRSAWGAQAREWFHGALFDVILWRDQDRQANIAIGLPDFPTYRNLAARIGWFEDAARMTYLWVSENRVTPVSGVGSKGI